MVIKDLPCVPVSESELQTQTESNGRLEILSTEGLELDEVSQQVNNGFSLPDNIYRSAVSNCTGDVQVGTRIVTPNVFVIDRNKESLDDIRNIINAASNDIINGAERGETNIARNYNSKLSTAEKSKQAVKKEVKVDNVTIVILIILIAVLILAFSWYHKKLNTHITDVNLNSDNPLITDSSTSQFTSQTTEVPQQELFITQEQCGDSQGQFCDSGNLAIADGIKISYTSNRCDTFDTCCKSLKYEKSFDVFRCSYDDIHYHFTISEIGEIYEGRHTECQIPLTYRECNQSLLEIGIFTGREGLICTNQYQKVIKQMESLTKLIQYSQNKSVISNGPLTLYFSNSSYTFCTDIYVKELRKTFNIQTISNYSSNFCDSVCM